MKTFYLKQREGDDRVILDTETSAKDNVLQTIPAKNWLDAREKVNTTQLWHNPGYGWYTR